MHSFLINKDHYFYSSYIKQLPLSGLLLYIDRDNMYFTPCSGTATALSGVADRAG